MFVLTNCLVIVWFYCTHYCFVNKLQAPGTAPPMIAVTGMGGLRVIKAGNGTAGAGSSKQGGSPRGTGAARGRR
jgi:hypothetical protein